MRRHLHRRLASLILLLGSIASVNGADWPHKLGPDGRSKQGPAIAGLDGLDQATERWTASIGTGYASVSIAGGRALSTGMADGQMTVYCFDADTGTVLWQHSFPSSLHPRFGSYSTPTIADNRVYAFAKEGQLLCFDLDDGSVIWQRHLANEYNLRPPRWGFASSPTLVGDMLVVNAGNHGIAIDRATGATRWASSGNDSGYATIVPADPQARQLLIFGGTALRAVDSASGSLRWSIPWRTRHDINAAAPLIHGNEIFISSGYGTGSGLVRVDDGEAELVWTDDGLQNQMSGGVLIDGHIYTINAHRGRPGDLVCFDLSTRRVRWTGGGFGQGSLIAAGDRLLVMNDSGALTLVAVDPSTYRPLGRRQVLPKGQSWTAPALAGTVLYVRNTAGHVAAWQLQP